MDPIKEPTSPTAAAAAGIARNIGLALSFVVTLWTLVSTHKLAEAYVYIISIPGIAGLSATLTGVLFVWGPAKNYLRQKLLKDTHTALHVVTGATSNAELNATVKALTEDQP